ncbi:MAG TPA: glutamyl-tRNA reductase, partial [Candidatus Polarisedimenticolia bacterium]|nr:glutamyl-tRNA reductase [Candidatus Polarisedimenticolia bacterium]
MPILLLGLNHVSAPLEVRERVAFPPEDLPGAVDRLVRTDAVEEALILSTCNRTEILVHARAGEAAPRLRSFLIGERRIAEEELERHCYLHADREAVRHVFRVASSLDSMVLGEAQILGQVKEAYLAAQQAGGLKRVLDSLMQRTFSVAKKVRSETGIARFPVSIAHAAADMARQIFGDLSDNALLIVGAGKMARLAVQHLTRDGVGSVVVVNRSFQRASELAREFQGRAAPLDRLFEEMERADVVVASTAAPHQIVRYEDAQRLGHLRRGRPLFFIDIAVPRDIDPRVNEIDNVYLYDIDDLQTVVRRNREERRAEAVQAESIIETETEAYVAWLRTLDMAPMIVDLRRRMHEMGARELQRFHGRLAGLAPEQRRTVEELTTALVNKFLHRPIQALKHAATCNGARGSLDLLLEAL